MKVYAKIGGLTLVGLALLLFRQLDYTARRKSEPVLGHGRTTQTNHRLVPLRVALAPVSSSATGHKSELFGPDWGTKPRAVITILAPKQGVGTSGNGSKWRREVHLERMLKLFDLHFNDRFDYPIVIFHEHNLGAAQQAEVRTWSRSRLFFSEFAFERPSNIGADVDLKFPGVCECGLCKEVGYKFMCLYQAGRFAMMPVLDGVDYVWRLDDDSIILNPVTDDVFERMRSQNMVYGYNMKSCDFEPCVRGLMNTTQAFVARAGLKPQWFNEINGPGKCGHCCDRPHSCNCCYPNLCFFYNNFEISRVALWRSREYQAYMAHVEASMGVFKYRWGDAPIKTIGVALFVPKEQIYEFADIAYKHAIFYVGPDMPLWQKKRNVERWYWDAEWGKQAKQVLANRSAAKNN